MKKETKQINNYLETLPYGFARHRIITDKEGGPVDYTFLEVNTAFEKMTGLKRENILGQRATTVLPGIEKSEFDWIGIYGKIALDGITLNFEQYFEPLKRWYYVKAYSDESGCFTTVLTEITTQKEELTSIRNLLELSEELIAPDLPSFDYQAAVNNLLELSGAKFAALNIYEDDYTKSVTRAITGAPGIIKRVSKILGFEIAGKAWEIKPERLHKIKGGKLVRFRSLFATSMGAINKTTAHLLQELGGIGDIYVLEMTYGEQQAMGDIIFFMPKKIKIQNREAIELYAGQLGVVLARLHSEHKHKQKSEELDRYFSNSLDLLCIANTDGEFVRVNKSWEEILGHSAADLEGRPFLDFVHPDDLPSTLEAVAKLDAQHEVVNFKNRYLCSDGSYRWIEWRSKPLGSTIYAVARDITEMVEIEEKKKFQLAFMQIAAEASSSLVGVAGSSEFDQAVNRVLERLGELLGADRSYLFQFSGELELMSNTHEWCAPGVETQMDNIQNQPTAGLPWWKMQIQKKKPVHIPDVSAMPAEAEAEKQEFASQNIRSLICLPTVGTQGRLTGFIGFDMIRDKFSWPQEQITMLQLVADTIGGALERWQSEEALQIANKNMSTVLENTFFGVVIIDKKRIIRWVNPVTCRLAGVDSAEDLIGHHCADYLCPGEQYDCPILDRGQTIENTERILRRKDGQVIPILKSVSKIILEGEEVLLETFIDISDRKQAEEGLRESEQRYREILETTQEGFYQVDLQGNLIDCNQAAANLLGYEEVELIGMNYRDLFKDPAAVFREFNQAFISGKTKFSVVMNAVRKDGGIVVSDLSVSLTYDKEGHITGFRGMGRDITERTRYAEKLKYLSLHDQLTGLYNRTYFENEMERLDQAREHPVALILADVDGLKLINDTIGHAEGDNYLKRIADLLKKSLRASDILARVGGDEFALLLPLTTKKDAEELAQRIRNDIDKSNHNRDLYPLGLSLGTAVAENNKQPLEETYKQADAAMYNEKIQQGNSTRSQIIDAILTSLKNSGVADLKNTALIEHISTLIGQAVGMKEQRLTDLLLLARVHDLGMISVPTILHKKRGSLSETEQTQLRQHVEHGYRIAQSTGELSRIAELILYHHENWDGSGYPLGLRDKDIPLECRILSIAVAYAQATKKPFPPDKLDQAALKAIQEMSGKAFDPHLVKLLTELADKQR